MNWVSAISVLLEGAIPASQCVGKLGLKLICRTSLYFLEVSFYFRFFSFSLNWCWIYSLSCSFLPFSPFSPPVSSLRTILLVFSFQFPLFKYHLTEIFKRSRISLFRMMWWYRLQRDILTRLTTATRVRVPNGFTLFSLDNGFIWAYSNHE